MTLWIDAQLSPRLAVWFQDRFHIHAIAVRDLGLVRSTDRAIFEAARAVNGVILTKDGDFVRLIEQHGPPPSIVWLTCGNTSNHALIAILETAWLTTVDLLASGDSLVEIGGGS